MNKRITILTLSILTTFMLSQVQVAESTSMDLPYYRTDIPELTRFVDMQETLVSNLLFPIKPLTPEEEALLKTKHSKPTQFMIIGTADGRIGEMNIKDNEQNFKDGNPTLNPGIEYPNGIYQDGRIILYLKGLIKGKYLLTTRIDSTKDNQDHLYKYINPERYYPVYGDNSILTNDADSQGQIFAKIERDTSYAELGNYSTEEFEKTQLARYNRVLHGIKTHYRTEDFQAEQVPRDVGRETKDEGRQTKDASIVLASEASGHPSSIGTIPSPQLRLTSFLANLTQDESEDSFSAEGISGPYYLSKTPILEYTERIRIETRDKNKSDTILNTTYLVRDRDYSIEYDNGRIFFHSPISSYDENNDPVYIVVRYEYSANTDLKYDIMGNRLEAYLFPRRGGSHQLMLAAQTIHEQRDLYNWGMYSADAILHLTPNMRFMFEFARSTKSNTEWGEAARAEASANFFNNKLTLQGYATEINSDFYNPTNVDETGLQKYGILANAYITDNLSIIADNWASYSIAADTYDRHTTIDGIWEDENLFLSLGYKLKEYVSNDNSIKDTHTHALESSQALTLRDNLILSNTALYEREYEFDLPVIKEKMDYRKDKFTLSPRLDFKMTDDLGLYIRHDLITNFSYSSIESSLYDSHTTAVGISRLTPEGIRNYVEYGFTGEGTNTTTIGQEAYLPITDRMTLKSYMNTKIEPYHTSENIGYNSKIKLAKNLYGNLNFERNKIENNNTISDYNSQSASVEYIKEENTIGAKFEHRDENEVTRYNLFSNASLNVSESTKLLGKLEASWKRDKDSEVTQEDYKRCLLGVAYRPIFSNSLNFFGKYEYKENLYQDTTVPVDTSTNIGSIEGVFAPYRCLSISAKYAVKQYTEASDNLNSLSLTDMYTVSPTFRLGEYIDITGIYRYLRNHDIKVAKYLASLETGVTIFDHLRVAAGYNFVEYDAGGDLPDEDYKGYGPYVNLSVAILEPDSYGAPLIKTLTEDRIERIKKRMIKMRIKNLLPTEKREFNQKYREAEALYKEERYKEAKALYNEIALKMARIKIDAGAELKSRIEEEKETLKLFNQAELLYKEGKYKEAKKLYEEVLRYED